MIKKLFLLTLCMGGLLPAVANDTAGTLLPTGEIEFTKQPEIVLKHEALLLSYTASVDYLFENTSSAAIRQIVFFPIPTTPIICYECDSHAFDFRVWSNGREVQPQLHRNITLNGTDVTRYFELMHVTDYTQHITFDPDTYGQDLEDAAAPLRKLPREQQEKLEKIGLLAKGCLETNPDTGKCTHNPQVYHLVPANYQQTVSYYWQQEFPPHQTVHIRHTYIVSANPTLSLIGITKNRTIGGKRLLTLLLPPTTGKPLLRAFICWCGATNKPALARGMRNSGRPPTHAFPRAIIS